MRSLTTRKPPGNTERVTTVDPSSDATWVTVRAPAAVRGERLPL
jgi:hypothetical protein